MAQKQTPLLTGLILLVLATNSSGEEYLLPKAAKILKESSGFCSFYVPPTEQESKNTFVNNVSRLAEVAGEYIESSSKTATSKRYGLEIFKLGEQIEKGRSGVILPGRLKSVIEEIIYLSKQFQVSS